MPEPTHAPRDSEEVKAGLLKPYVGAYTQIDFSRPCPSIFDTAQEIKEKYGIRAVRAAGTQDDGADCKGLKSLFWITQSRSSSSVITVESVNRMIFGCRCLPLQGSMVMELWSHIWYRSDKLVLQKDRSKDVREPLTTIVSKNEHCLISPTLIQYHSETAKGEVRGQNIEDPIMTVDGSNRYGLVTSFLHKYYDGGYKGAGESVENPLPTVTAWDHNSVVTANLIQMNNHCDGRDIIDPLPTITAGDGHFGEVRAFLIKYYGNGSAEDVTEPLDTITSRGRFGLVTIQGVDYQIVDIGLRMLEPRELYGCQGFPEDYIIDHDFEGRTYPRSEQVRRCGNSVCPPLPAAMVRSNLPELCGRRECRISRKIEWKPKKTDS